MRAALVTLLIRLATVSAAHVLFVTASIALLLLSNVLSAAIGPVQGVLVSIFVVIPLLINLMVPLTLPSLICSLIIYPLGALLSDRVAMAIAALGGAALLFVAFSGSYPKDMHYPFSNTMKAALTAIYLLCWAGVGRYLPKFLETP